MSQQNTAPEKVSPPIPMPTYAALLYSIVLTPERRVVMADLRSMALDLGLRSPRTLVSTGNLVFATDDTPNAELEARLEAGFEKRFGKPVDIIVREASDWRRTVAANPFPSEAAEDANRVMVRVMRSPLGGDTLPRLQHYLTSGERVAIAGGDLWAHFTGQPSQSKLLAALTRKRLGIGTSRNWNTVRRLGEMFDESRG